MRGIKHAVSDLQCTLELEDARDVHEEAKTTLIQDLDERMNTSNAAHQMAMGAIEKIVATQATAVASLGMEKSALNDKSDKAAVEAEELVQHANACDVKCKELERLLLLARRMAVSAKPNELDGVVLSLRNQIMMLKDENKLVTAQVETLRKHVQDKESTPSARQWQLEGIVEKANEKILLLERKIQMQQRQFVNLQFDQR